MKLFNKFYALCGLAACSIFVFFWVLISNRYLYTVADAVGSRAGFKAAAEFEKRLVVFGDSWSDNNARENRVWTEWLCALVGAITNIFFLHILFFMGLSDTDEKTDVWNNIVVSSHAIMKTWRRQQNHQKATTSGPWWIIPSWIYRIRYSSGL